MSGSAAVSYSSPAFETSSEGSETAPILDGAAYSTPKEQAGLAPLSNALPFVYTAPSNNHDGLFPEAGKSFAATSYVSDATLHLFDSWITTLAPWTQAGTATVVPQDGGLEGYYLAVDGMTHGGRNA
jgi:hypothetical protein